MRSFICIPVALALFGPTVGSAQLIGVYQDPQASTCNLSVPYPGPPVDVYVVFTPGTEVTSLDSAWFRIDGLPSGWIAEQFPNPAGMQVFGDLFFEFSGDVINFSDCQEGTVVLWRVRLTPTSSVTNHAFRVRAHGAQPVDLPGGAIPCPAIGSCDPQMGGMPLPEAMALINSTSICIAELEGRCPTASDAPPPPSVPSWSVVKQLYQD